jgi:hypothetical protein
MGEYLCPLHNITINLAMGNENLKQCQNFKDTDYAWNSAYTWCSLRRLIRLLSTWCRMAAFFSVSGTALSLEVRTVK